MPGTGRVVVSDGAHHVTQRGNNRRDVFFVDAGRRALRRGREGCCLMTGRVHLVVTSKDEVSLPEALKRTNQLHAQYINRLHGDSQALQASNYGAALLAYRSRATIDIILRELPQPTRGIATQHQEALS